MRPGFIYPALRDTARKPERNAELHQETGKEKMERVGMGKAAGRVDKKDE